MITSPSASDGAWIDPSFTWQAAGAWKVEPARRLELQEAWDDRLR